MISEDLEITMKVIAVGNGRVGKTSLISHFSKDRFISEYKKTLGCDFLEKRMYVPEIGEEILYYLWDTAGQEEYDAMTRGYYKGASAALLVFSTTDRASFDSIESWYKKVKEECGNIYTVLVQNKVDLIDEAVVTPAEVADLANRLNMKLYRCCVKEGLSVAEIFKDVAVEYIKRKNEGNAQSVVLPTVEERLEGIKDERKSENVGVESGGSQAADRASTEFQTAEDKEPVIGCFRLSKKQKNSTHKSSICSTI